MPAVGIIQLSGNWKHQCFNELIEAKRASGLQLVQHCYSVLGNTFSMLVQNSVQQSLLIGEMIL